MTKMKPGSKLFAAAVLSCLASLASLFGQPAYGVPPNWAEYDGSAICEANAVEDRDSFGPASVPNVADCEVRRAGAFASAEMNTFADTQSGAIFGSGIATVSEPSPDFRDVAWFLVSGRVYSKVYVDQTSPPPGDFDIALEPIPLRATARAGGEAIGSASYSATVIFVDFAPGPLEYQASSTGKPAFDFYLNLEPDLLVGDSYRIIVLGNCKASAQEGYTTYSNCTVFADPTFEFDQATFDSRMGANTFPLRDYFEIVVSPNLRKPGFRQVSSGFHHSCGVTTDRGVVCWGSNDYGEASPPPGTYDVNPQTGELRPIPSYLQVSSGLRHSCGVTTYGGLICWGWNDYGQASPPPGWVAIDQWTGEIYGVRPSYVQVSAGSYHSCGVKTDGGVVCWGSNNSGQASPPTGTFRQVSAGTIHSCGVKTDGSVVCWGENRFGEASPPPGAFAQVSAGWLHSCGVKTDGGVVCWGMNDYGEASPPTGAFVQVSAGRLHSCGVKTDGGVVCWGMNDHGEASPPPDAFVQISSGFHHSCGVKTDGGVVCWGYNQFGQASPPP